MESSRNYDELLLKIKHYSNHTEMLPFIGQNFEKNKILIISESHFVPKNIKDQVDDSWYLSNFDLKPLQNNTNSRAVISQISKGKGHGLFQNISSALKEVNKDFCLNDIAWYNFYQKPASFGKSINPSKLDKEIAISVFESILEILSPSVIIFVSLLSFKELNHNRNWSKELGGHKYKNFNIPIGIVPHPSSQWWNKKSKTHQNRTGKQKFIDILKTHV